MSTYNQLINQLSGKTISSNDVISPNFKPVWINNVTRLNAQNLNENMYRSINSYVSEVANKSYELSNEQISLVLNQLAGYRPDPDSTNEIHNITISAEGSGKTNNLLSTEGKYQAVFGQGNETGDVEGQFLIGNYVALKSTNDDTLFAIGNGTAENENVSRSNAFTVSTKGSVTTGSIVLKDTVTESSPSNTATTKKYVDELVASISSIRIRNTDAECTCNYSDVQTYATQYIVTNLGRQPKDYDGLLITVTGSPSGSATETEIILYVYTNGLWINAGLNDVDLSDYYTKTETNNEITNAINGLDVSDNVLANNFVTKVTQTNGKITVSRARPTITNVQGLQEALNGKQETLVSGTNIKTINNTSVLGTGNFDLPKVTFTEKTETVEIPQYVNEAVTQANEILMNLRDATVYDANNITFKLYEEVI